MSFRGHFTMVFTAQELPDTGTVSAGAPSGPRKASRCLSRVKKAVEGGFWVAPERNPGSFSCSKASVFTAQEFQNTETVSTSAPNGP